MVRFEGSMSWSKLDLYEQCPLKFKLMHIDSLREAPSIALVKGDRVHKTLDRWLKHEHPVLPMEAMPMKIRLHKLKRTPALTGEQPWPFAEGFEPIARLSFGTGDWFRAKIDALIIAKDTATVIDFKTGKNRGATSQQVLLYALLTLLRYPNLKKVRPEFWYLEHDFLAPGCEVTKAEVPSLRKSFIGRINIVKTEKEWKPKKNKFCDWCSFQKSKGGPCPL